MTRSRLRLWAIAALVLAFILFVTTVQVLQWVALVLVFASILVLMWTLFTGARGDAR